MQCERAQEFFSDYLEATLDRPMTVALEAHLASCAPCREECESLQATWQSLNTLPAVEPPPDGVTQVMRTLYRLRAEQQDAERAKAPGFLEWLRGLSPARAAMATGLAALVVVGIAQFKPTGETRLGIGGPGGKPTTAVQPAPALTAGETASVKVSYDRLTPSGQEVTLKFVAPVELVRPVVQLTGAAINQRQQLSGNLPAKTDLTIPIVVPLGPQKGEAVRLSVTSAEAGKQYQYLVAVPLNGGQGQLVTLSLFDQPMDEALRRLAPSLDLPLVVEGGPQGTVSLTVDGIQPSRAAQALADAAGYEVRLADGIYHLIPR